MIFTEIDIRKNDELRIPDHRDSGDFWEVSENKSMPRPKTSTGRLAMVDYPAFASASMSQLSRISSPDESIAGPSMELRRSQLFKASLDG